MQRAAQANSKEEAMKVGSALVNAGTEFHSFVVPGFVAGEF